MKKFIVAWMTGDLSRDDNQDHYRVFIGIDGDLTPEMQAKGFYQELLQDINVCTANLCEIIKSTDYETIDQNLTDFAATLDAIFYVKHNALHIFRRGILLFSCCPDNKGEDYWDSIPGTQRRPDYDLNLWDDDDGNYKLSLYPIVDGKYGGETNTSVFEKVRLEVFT